MESSAEGQQDADDATRSGGGAERATMEVNPGDVEVVDGAIAARSGGGRRLEVVQDAVAEHDRLTRSRRLRFERPFDRRAIAARLPCRCPSWRRPRGFRCRGEPR